jgi:outer membrane protein assembly factor BamB
MKKSKRISILAVLVYCISASLLCAATAAQEEFEWPCFHGLQRNSKSAETALLKEWPEEGPELLWTISGLGEGYSSVSIAEGHLYTAGMIGKQTYVFAFDLNGKQVWKKPNGSSWEATMSHARSYTGSRSTPTHDNGVVYHLGETGRLAAFDYRTGKEIWALELREMFDAEIPEYGYSESIYIDGDRLYCNPAGKKGFMVCLNKENGELIWANTEIQGAVGFSSPIIAESNGYRQIIAITSNSVYGADTETGKLLWSVEFENDRSNNVADPIFHDGHVFASSGYGKGSILIELKTSDGKVIPETVWQTDLMDNHHGGVILHDGYLYGAGHSARGWFCLDFVTGKQMWNTQGKGSLFYADNMFYLLEEKGTMKLVRATPEKYDIVSSFEVPEGGKGMHWTHPVVCGGRLYVRHTDKLFAYDIRDKQAL